MIGVSVLGSTGSIGVSTLDVLARHPERYRVVALTANRDVDALYRQCHATRPVVAAMADRDAAKELARRLQSELSEVRVLSGPDGLIEAAGLPAADCVMAAIVGAAGLDSTLAAVRLGKQILLANKEALVVAGRIFMDAAKASGATILPIDSEHNAIFQSMPPDFSDGLDNVGVRRILLTASGGPFRTWSRESLEQVTPEQACAHPNWDMGRKISVDSATMMNKGLEVIEARWLFDAPPDLIQVVVHPQSVIHSMVEYVDGSVLAQLGNPDMRTPIAHALAWPERVESGVAGLDLVSIGRLDFEAPDFDRFPCLKLAYDAVTAGGTAPAVLNAANEVAVNAFLSRRLSFNGIAGLIDAVCQQVPTGTANDLTDLMVADTAARRTAEQMVLKAVI
jgi:1-deoxy-D-xylulose-5-phosphate reductoisomerase